MGVYLRDNMGCMTDFGYVILDTNLPTFMTIQACSKKVTGKTIGARYLRRKIMPAHIVKAKNLSTDTYMYIPIGETIITRGGLALG